MKIERQISKMRNEKNSNKVNQYYLNFVYIMMNAVCKNSNVCMRKYNTFVQWDFSVFVIYLSYVGNMCAGHVRFFDLFRAEIIMKNI